MKTAGILMIIGGVLGLILNVLAVLGTAFLVIAFNHGRFSDLSSGLLFEMAITAFATAVIMIIAGIVGVINCRKPEKARSCITWAVIVFVTCLFDSVLTVAAGNSFPTLIFLIGLILPGLYIIGVIKNRTA